MNLSEFEPSRSQEVTDLFCGVFTDSEGQEEGRLIGSLVSELIATTDAGDLFGFVATFQGKVVGSVFFSRLTFDNNVAAFILSPVAVHTSHQGKGVGKKLITFGIEQLKARGVDLVFTYGDPDFYSKVGFRHISEESVKSPLKLTHPEGWLAQSLSSDTVDPISGMCRCVKALNKQEYW